MDVTQEAINLRERLAQARRPFPPKEEDFWFDGDGSKTEFVLPRGWIPHRVFSAGLIKRKGSAEDYTVTRDVDTYTVKFVTAPGVVDVCVTARLPQ